MDIFASPYRVNERAHADESVKVMELSAPSPCNNNFVKVASKELLPLEVVIITFWVPAMPAGAVQVSEAGELTITLVQLLPPMVSVVSPVTKPPPVTVTDWPAVVDPEFGVTAEIVGLIPPRLNKFVISATESSRFQMVISSRSPFQGYHPLFQAPIYSKPAVFEFLATAAPVLSKAPSL